MARKGLQSETIELALEAALCEVLADGVRHLLEPPDAYVHVTHATSREWQTLAVPANLTPPQPGACRVTS